MTGLQTAYETYPVPVDKTASFPLGLAVRPAPKPPMPSGTARAFNDNGDKLPTAAQQRRRWDRLRLELREQAKALGLPVPPPRRHPDYTAVRAQARREMLTLIEQADDR